MTRQILEQGGVVGDFHGDAAMGFWGWPLPQADAVARACHAALGIRAAFGREGIGNRESGIGSPESGVGSPIPYSQLPTPSPFRVGIGIASGRAVAGKIGTVDQVKVTVFGPVVNLAARLETMTRQLHGSILIDPPTAAMIRASVPNQVCRVRRFARVRPVGFAAPLEVSELLPPAHDCPELTDEQLTSYEAALLAFERGDWPLALKQLRAAPHHDAAADFLVRFINEQAHTLPPQWDGAIALSAK